MLHMTDAWDPNQFSIEIATVFATSKNETKYRVGDRVLIDFAIFTAGIQQKRFKTSARSRCIGNAGDDYYYWADRNEIFAVAKGEQIVPNDDIILLKQTKKKPATEAWLFCGQEDDYEKKGSLYVSKADQENTPYFATVFASSIPEIAADDEVYIAPGVAGKIKFEAKELEYIRLFFILGMKKQGDSTFILL